jgi:hypothetical protein
MAVFRFLSAVFLLVATVALVVDATPRIYGAGPLVVRSLGDHWKNLSPTSLAAAKATVGRIAPAWAWESVIAPVLSVPTWAMFGGLALVSGYAGRRRKTVRVFVN